MTKIQRMAEEMRHCFQTYD